MHPRTWRKSCAAAAICNSWIRASAHHCSPLPRIEPDLRLIDQSALLMRRQPGGPSADWESFGSTFQRCPLRTKRSSQRSNEHGGSPGGRDTRRERSKTYRRGGVDDRAPPAAGALKHFSIGSPVAFRPDDRHRPGLANWAGNKSALH
jgi:hypothetical protein